MIPYQYLPLLKDGILRRVTVLLCLSKPTYRAKDQIMKKHYIKKETVFHHISHTVEKKISTEIFSTNFKVFDIVMRQQDSLRRRDSPRGVSLGVLGGDVPPCSPNPGPILDQNMLFCCISRNMSSSLRLAKKPSLELFHGSFFWFFSKLNCPRHIFFLPSFRFAILSCFNLVETFHFAFRHVCLHLRPQVIP